MDFNWNGAAVGLLSGAQTGIAAYTKRQEELENQRLQDERDRRKERAQLEREMTLAKFRNDLERAGKKEDTAAAGEEWTRRHGIEQTDKLGLLAQARQEKLEDTAAANDEWTRRFGMEQQTLTAREEARAKREAEKPGATGQMINDLVKAGKTPEEAVELVTGKIKGQEKDPDGKRLEEWNKVRESHLKTTLGDKINPKPEEKAAAIREAEAYATRVMNFTPSGLRPQILPGATATGNAPTSADMPVGRAPTAAVRKYRQLMAAASEDQKEQKRIQNEFMAKFGSLP